MSGMSGLTLIVVSLPVPAQAPTSGDRSGLTFASRRAMRSFSQASISDATHAIEVQYFGERATTGLFGEDESTQRQLLTLMRQDNTPGLTMEQRADRAQEHYDQLHQTAVAK